MPITGFCQETKQEVETHLSLISRKLATSLKTRKHDLAILEHAKEAFPFKETNFTQCEAEEKLENLHNSLPSSKKDIFKLPDILPGYSLFLDFCNSSTIHTPVKPEILYDGFFQLHKDNLLVLPFLKFFEFIQSKSYSEAICETIGSIMKIHGGKGRNLLSFNFSKEIYLNFNMPPLQVMKSTIISRLAKYLVENEKKDYSRRTHMSRWLHKTVSSTVWNFRKSEEKNLTHLSTFSTTTCRWT